MSSENSKKGIEIVKKMYEIYEKQDVGGFGDILAFDFQMEVIGDAKYSGRYKGKDAHKSYFQERKAYAEMCSFKPIDFFSTGDGKVVNSFIEVRGKNKKDGNKSFIEYHSHTIWLNSFWKVSKARENFSRVYS